MTFTTCCALTFESGGWTPDKAIVKSQYVDTMKAILKRITDQNSYVLINLYPHFAVLDNRNNPAIQDILKNALFERLDPTTGRYMFGNMVENYRVAFNKIGYANVPLAVGETGWPRHINNDQNGPYLNLTNHTTYMTGLKKWLTTNQNAIPVFIFEFRDEKNKPGRDIGEPYFGFYTDATSPVNEDGLCQ